MDSLVELSWRAYPAAVLMAIGTAVAIRGTYKELCGLRGSLGGDSTKLVTWIQGFRLSIIRLALAGIGAVWEWHLTWLFVLSLVVGGEETLESSVVIFALKRGQRQKWTSAVYLK